MGTRHSTPFENRFWSKVDREGPEGIHYETKKCLGPCWVWTGAKTANGYGQFYLGQNLERDRKASLQTYAHRYAYEITIGPIPKPQLDHLCRNRLCVNPAHLEPVTNIENVQRGAIARPKRTHCAKGHELTEDNVYVHGTRGTRQCKECVRLAGLERERQRTAERTLCGRGHPLANSASMSEGRPGKRYCPTCRAARSQPGKRGAIAAPKSA
jgi:hypothetical protein